VIRQADVEHMGDLLGFVIICMVKDVEGQAQLSHNTIVREAQLFAHIEGQLVIK
jgi:hypothetical protein